ncbi:MAG: peptide chain release factor 3 [Pirellulaceae bacterium]|nr:peptide chain release factor 3 [Pirellulaceae bacterium]
MSTSTDSQFILPPTSEPLPSSNAEMQRKRRRTFAIISHPDAGKTTLTEKLLLFGGSIEIAGVVRGRKTQRAATSDWMEMEKQRGISVSSTALTFEYAGCQVNLLDTPGHHDFSEDTYRTLMAADAAVMVIDLAKGIETQTEKLFQVCHLRKIPIITFVNKVDRPGRASLEILDEIERRFSLEPIPQNWPLGTGADFEGIVDLNSDQLYLFNDRQGSRRIAADVMNWHELEESNQVSASLINSTRDEVELVRSAGGAFNEEAFLSGRQTPVFFGSALTNFGVEHFLNGFLRLCPPPGVRPNDTANVPVDPTQFSGFVFKIQANLDPRHRDRVAFVRVCSGRFERDMEITIARSGKKTRLSRAVRIFGQDRITIEEAYPGDIIGLVCPGEFRLGDTLCDGPVFSYDALPQFSPEFFAVLDCSDTGRRKQFDRGLAQLIEEGAIQMFHDPRSTRRECILGAVGELQFDVVQFRLQSEYNAASRVSWRPYKLARWFDLPDLPKAADANEIADRIKLPYAAKLVKDQFGHDAVLLQTDWDLTTLLRENPKVSFQSIRTEKKLTP